MFRMYKALQQIYTRVFYFSDRFAVVESNDDGNFFLSKKKKSFIADKTYC